MLRLITLTDTHTHNR